MYGLIMLCSRTGKNQLILLELRILVTLGEKGGMLTGIQHTELSGELGVLPVYSCRMYTIGKNPLNCSVKICALYCM